MQTDYLSLSNIIPSILEMIITLQEPSLPKTLTTPLLQALRNHLSNFLDASVDSFDPLPSAASFLDSATCRDDMVPQLTSAKACLIKLVRLKNTYSLTNKLH